MKFLIVCLAIASCASAALLPSYKHTPTTYHQPTVFHQPTTFHQPTVHHPVSHHVGSEAAAPVLKSNSDIHPDGQYKYEYETGNGIAAQEAGLAAHQVQGSYSYTAPDGTPIQMTYVADENGFQPTGSHLPVAPPVPAAIQRALEYIAAHPYHEEAHHVTRVIPVTVKPAYTPFRFNKF